MKEVKKKPKPKKTKSKSGQSGKKKKASSVCLAEPFSLSFPLNDIKATGLFATLIVKVGLS